MFSPQLVYPLSVVLFMLLGMTGVNAASAVLFLAFLLTFLLGFRFSGSGGDEPCPVVWMLGTPMFVFGAVAEFINILYVGGIPLLNPDARLHLIPLLSYAAFLIVPGSVVKITESLMKGDDKEALFWFVSGTFLISLLGYRTEIFALLLGALVSFYYTRRKRLGTKRVLKYLAVLLIVALLLNVGVISFRDMPLTGFLDRFSLTNRVFSSMIDSMGLSVLGVGGGIVHHSILSSPGIIPGPKTGPRTYISRLIGVGKGSTTPTVLGLPYLDSGMLGVLVTGLLLGLLFGRGYKNLKKGRVDILPLHAVCMAFLLITIETGIGDFIILLYFILYAMMAI